MYVYIWVVFYVITLIRILISSLCGMWLYMEMCGGGVGDSGLCDRQIGTLKCTFHKTTTSSIKKIFTTKMNISVYNLNQKLYAIL